MDYDKGIGGEKSYGGKVDDKKSKPEYRKFVHTLMENALKVSAKDSHHFWYHDGRYTGMMQTLFDELGIKYKRTCLWIKNGANMTPQTAFSKMYEPALYGVKGRPYLSPKHTKFAEILNRDIGTGNAALDDIMDMVDIWLAKRDAGQDYEHPTQKPLSLHERPLNRCTKIGDAVLDLCGGSGSTLLSCEQMRRRAFLVEKNPVFCQVIVNRYEKFTGDKAIKLD